MIKECIKAFDLRRDCIKKELRKQHPCDYEELVHLVVSAINAAIKGAWIDIPLLDLRHMVSCGGGDYHGTECFLLQAGHRGFVTICVEYGSCSVCDTLRGIQDSTVWDDSGVQADPTEEQVQEYFTLCLHIAQSIRWVKE